MQADTDDHQTFFKSALMVTSFKIISIQSLRAIAAIFVVYFHSQTILFTLVQNSNINLHSQVQSFLKISGSFGVDIFFVVSGFIMVTTTWNSERTLDALLRFNKNRIIRIIPLYWVYTIIYMLVGLLIIPGFGASITEESLICSFFLIPYSNPFILPVGWTLTYELYFYLVFSFGFLVNRKISIVGKCLFFVVCVISGFFQNTKPSVMMDSILLEFVYGIVIGVYYNKFRNINSYIGWIILICGILILYGFEFNQRYQGVLWGIPAACIVLWGLSRENVSHTVMKGKILTSLGDASYSLYLSHYVILVVCSFFVYFSGLYLVLNTDFLLFCLVGIVLFLNNCLYLRIELVIIGWFKMKAIERA